MFSRSFKGVGLHYTAFRDAIREDSRQITPSRGVSPRKKFAVKANVESRVRLCDQLSRAVVSIPSNIAEGNGRSSRTDYAHFLAIARGSLYETMTQLEIAKRQRYLADYAPAAELATSIRKMLNSMISKLTM